MAAIITLTTDFGLTDAYVAVMRGVMLAINPEIKFVDICHTIKPQDIRQAAFVLNTAYPFFPERTIHLVVVDPGVGSERRAIILRTPTADFVAPDNGVLSYVIRQFIRGILKGRSPFKDHASPSYKEDIPEVELEPGLEAVAITKSEFWRSPVSPTFHGRDVFAPVAARLSLGLPPSGFGEEIASVAMLPLPEPYEADDGSLVGQILHIDSFGNLIANIRGDDLPQTGEGITIEIGNRHISGLSRTYAEGTGLLALIGSSGYLEVSLKEGSASALLAAGVGSEIRVRRGVSR